MKTAQLTDFSIKAVLTAWCLLTVAIILPASVKAEPLTPDPIVQHCRKVLPAKAKSACTDSNGKPSDELLRARKVAAQNCEAKRAGKEKDGCIVEKANKYIDLANNHVLNAADFNKKLEVVIRDKGDPDKKDPDAEKSSTNTICDDGKCVDEAADPNADCSNGRCDLIKKYVNPVINLLSLCFGVIAAASLITGGIQYSASAGDSQKVTNAKKRIFNTLLAVVAYIFMYSFLQFLVPGGVFNR